MNKRALVVAPEHWRPLVQALLPVFGEHDVANFMGGRPSYNLYEAVRTAHQEQDVLHRLLGFTSPASIDVAKAVRATGAAPELKEAIDALPHQLETAYLLKRMVLLAHEQQPFSVIVTTCTYDPIGMSMLSAARELGVPLVYVHHGCHSITPEDAWYVRDYRADWTLCPGDRDREWWHACAPDYRNIEVTGHPLWDVYAAARDREPPQHTLPVVLWAAESGANAAQTPAIWGSRDVPERAFAAFLAGVARLEQSVEVMIKVRSGESEELVQRWAQQTGDALCDTKHHFSFSSEDAYEALLRADVVVCQDSSIGVEALHLGLPVISITRPGGCLFDGSGAIVLNGKNPILDSELHHGIERVLEEGQKFGADHPDTAMYYNRGVDGRAMERVVGKIAEVAGAPRLAAQAV